jgi:hypothetical protein
MDDFKAGYTRGRDGLIHPALKGSPFNPFDKRATYSCGLHGIQVLIDGKPEGGEGELDRALAQEGVAMVADFSGKQTLMEHQVFCAYLEKLVMTGKFRKVMTRFSAPGKTSQEGDQQCWPTIALAIDSQWEMLQDIRRNLTNVQQARGASVIEWKPLNFTLVFKSTGAQELYRRLVGLQNGYHSVGFVFTEVVTQRTCSRKLLSVLKLK